MTARSVLDGMKARLGAATPGPWRTWKDNGGRRGSAVETAWAHDADGEDTELITDWCSPSDATFIAAAPTDVARLVAAVEAALDVAETLETYTTNTRNNNITLDREWEARASGYDAAVTLLRAAIENALAKESQ